MLRNKKGTIYFMLAVVVLTILALSTAYVLLMKASKISTIQGEDYIIGSDALRAQVGAVRADTHLFYLDLAAEFAAYNALSDLAENGGYVEGSPLGLYSGLPVWYDAGEHAFPVALDSELTPFVNLHLNQYLESYPAAVFQQNNYYIGVQQETSEILSIKGNAKDSIELDVMSADMPFDVVLGTGDGGVGDAELYPAYLEECIKEVKKLEIAAADIARAGWNYDWYAKDNYWPDICDPDCEGYDQFDAIPDDLKLKHNLDDGISSFGSCSKTSCCGIDYAGCTLGIAANSFTDPKTKGGGMCCGTYVWNVFFVAEKKYGLRVNWPLGLKEKKRRGKVVSQMYTRDPNSLATEYRWIKLNSWNHPSLSYKNAQFKTNNLLPGDIVYYVAPGVKFSGPNDVAGTNSNAKGKCTESSACYACRAKCRAMPADNPVCKGKQCVKKRCFGKCYSGKAGPCYGGTSHINIVGTPVNKKNTSFRALDYGCMNKEDAICKGTFPKYIDTRYYCSQSGRAKLVKGDSWKYVYRVIPACVAAGEARGDSMNTRNSGVSYKSLFEEFDDSDDIGLYEFCNDYPYEPECVCLDDPTSEDCRMSLFD
ncbi:hypothetical protein HN419_02050 [Candidatus Woesearchaeota archaeon]|jgi:hypothetical protein|nr:hypothetical protein [Candidatus Woesearchaeota archaeon]MBT3537220.1 hypothetical protein [Candidatus Woesearchaeota archaeon]MBT4698207.1 hypothetical protein [Candidatus Woesearchaeota archaeon]MBT4717748.1 hypothetical protein [Candidatus Woesearchaeota archaeon]MBT7106470.1 hypothetical protein [Candidatus Woesearchaeota archaeon]